MHMSDALISPAVGSTFWAGTIGVIAYCTRKLKQQVDEKLVPLMGILGAFIFAAQMINFTIPGTGASGHISGGVILAVLLGPSAGFVTISSVLILQSLFFADGGILALGCNIWNLGVFPCFIAYPLIFRPIVAGNRSSRRITIASVASVVVALELGALGVVFQTLLSGKTDLPFAAFSALLLPIQFVIALIEGFITAGIITYMQSIRPEMLESTMGSGNIPSVISLRKVFLTFAAATLITGGLISWFASSHPDGLEWSLQKMPVQFDEAPSGEGLSSRLDRIQEKTAILPDYGLRDGPEEDSTSPVKRQWAAGKGERSLSGLAGSAMVLAMVLLIGFGLRFMGKRS